MEKEKIKLHLGTHKTCTFEETITPIFEVDSNHACIHFGGFTEIISKIFMRASILLTRLKYLSKISVYMKWKKRIFTVIMRAVLYEHNCGRTRYKSLSVYGKVNVSCPTWLLISLFELIIWKLPPEITDNPSEISLIYLIIFRLIYRVLFLYII